MSFVFYNPDDNTYHNRYSINYPRHHTSRYDPTQYPRCSADCRWHNSNRVIANLSHILLHVSDN